MESRLTQDLPLIAVLTMSTSIMSDWKKVGCWYLCLRITYDNKTSIESSVDGQQSWFIRDILQKLIITLNDGIVTESTTAQ